MNTMAMIGNFAFNLNDKYFDRMNRTRNYNFAEIQKAQDHAGLQSLGKDIEEISISGSLTTIQSGIDPLGTLYTIADKKEPVSFVFGYGAILGDFVITKIDEVRSIFLDDGRSIKFDFTIELKKVYL